MKNKKILVIGAIISVILIIVGVLFLFKTEPDVEIVKNQKYVIKEWNNFAQRVYIDVVDESIVNYVKSTENDAPEGADTGGENTLYTITGLKEGKTKVTINIIDSNDFIVNSNEYYLNVDNNLNVTLDKKEKNEFDVYKNYVIKEWNNFAQRVEAIIENEDIVKYIEFKTADSKENVATGGEYTIYNIIGLKEGKTKVTVNVINPDGTYESIKDYELSVNSELKIEELSVSITKVD